jgi:hypothetical protein
LLLLLVVVVVLLLLLSPLLLRLLLPHWQAAARAVLALSVALNHPELSTTPQILCAAACTCRSWREAVQQCRACNTVIKIGPNTPLLQLSSFAKWLPQHAALVKSIELLGIDLPYDESEVHPAMERDCYISIAQQLLLPALQLAASKTAAAQGTQQLVTYQPAAAAAAAAPGGTDIPLSGPPPQQQQQQAWRVASFRSAWPNALGMLAALPAHSLTQLHLTLDEDAPPSSVALAAALARLSSLEQLQLDSENPHRSEHAAWSLH